MGQAVKQGARVAVRTHNGHSRNRNAFKGYEFGTVDYVVAGNAEVLFDDDTRCRLGVTELLAGPAVDVLESLASSAPVPASPFQYLIDLGYRQVNVVRTDGSREVLATFDVDDLDKAEQEMDRYAATGKYDDEFGTALALEAVK